MNTSINHLPRREQRHLGLITKNIVQAINPEYLIYYGSRASLHSRRSCLLQPSVSAVYEYEYDLAVLVSDQGELHSDHMLQRAREATAFCSRSQIILHRSDSVFREILGTDTFFARLFRNGILLHSTRELPPEVASYLLAFDPDALSADMQPRLFQKLADALKLIDQAMEQQKAKNLPLALYYIKRSLEKSLLTMVLACVGYRSFFSASLYELLDYTRHFTQEAADIFPCNTREEARLLRLLVRVSETELPDNERRPSVPEFKTLLDRAAEMHLLAVGWMKKCQGVMQEPGEQARIRAHALLLNSQ